MHRISKTFSFCYGHRLLGDKGKCRHVHGHTGKVEIELAGELDGAGMVFHFDKLKETIGTWIADNLDHTLLLCKEDPLVHQLKSSGERFLEFESNPTAENIARLVFDKSKDFQLPVASITVWESDTSKATYAA